MPTFEVQGPDPDGAFWIVRVETISGVESRMQLDESYSSAEDAQADADAFSADPENAPTA